jgi:hypothetical protein
MKIEEALEEIKNKPTVPLWPHLGLVFDLSRGSVYTAARNGTFETIRVGNCIPAISAPLRRKLGIDAA